MSKDGPPADSFVNPQRTGWLTKLGGSGMSANWRKRWFVLDHHYIFYYKQKNDKKPVGVVCLADYKLCRKAEQKECKKNFSFILEKGDLVDDLDYPVKNYVIYADNESDMNQWINDINVEIQPTTGRRAPTKEQVIVVDEKAFDEVSTTASENPKLVHPTAARPRVKGRRPPRRYIPYHEDDTKEDSGENVIPSSQSRASPTAQPKQSSPATEPKSPSIPTKPKSLSTSPSHRRPYKTEGGSPGSTRRKPMISKNKPILPREESKTLIAAPGGSKQAKDEEGTKPSPPTTKPKVPMLPLTTSKPSQKKSMDGVMEEKQTSPSVQRKVLVSEEANSPGNELESTEKILNGVGIPGEDPVSDQPSSEHKEPTTPKPVPRPKPRKPWDSSPRSPSPTEQPTLAKTSKPRPIPRARTVAPGKPTKLADELVSEANGKESPEEEQVKDLPVSDDHDVITVAYQQTSSDSIDVEPQNSVRDTENKKELGVTLRQISYQNVTVNIKDTGEVTLSAALPDTAGPKENSAESQKHPSQLAAGSHKEPSQDKSLSNASADVQSSAPNGSPSKGDTGKPAQNGNSEKYGNGSNAAKPAVVQAPRQETKAESVGSASSSSPRKASPKLKPAENHNQIPQQKSSLPSAADEEEHYVEVDMPRIQEKPSLPDVGVYDVPRPSCSPDPQLGSPSPPDNSYDFPNPLNMDILSQNRQKPLGMEGDASKTSTSALLPEYETTSPASNQGIASSTTPSHIPPSSSSQVGSYKGENGVATESNEEGQRKESIGHYGPSPRRDPWGYAIVNKDIGNGFRVASEEPHDWLAKHLQSVDSDSVPECVQKAKELLRQARIIKVQAEESRKEARRELELARRERHDAALMKKNAAEILRIAKEKLKL